MKRILIASAVTVVTAGTALAGQCPTDMAKIDQALAKSPPISGEQMAQVMELRGDGEARHAAGQHGEAQAALAEAKDILGLN